MTEFVENQRHAFLIAVKESVLELFGAVSENNISVSQFFLVQRQEYIKVAVALAVITGHEISWIKCRFLITPAVFRGIDHFHISAVSFGIELNIRIVYGQAEVGFQQDME